MLFVKKTNPTVVVEDNAAARAEAEMIAEDRGRASATVAVLGVLAVVVLLLLVGYFAWWAPVNAAEANENATPVVQHDTQVIEKPTPPTGPTTIVNNPPVTPPTVVTPPPSNPPTVVTPPTVIHENHYVPVPMPNNSGSNTSNNGGNNNGNGTNNGGENGTGDMGTTGQ